MVEKLRIARKTSKNAFPYTLRDAAAGVQTTPAICTMEK